MRVGSSGALVKSSVLEPLVVGWGLGGPTLSEIRGSGGTTPSEMRGLRVLPQNIL